jgi:hypothetical protein
MDRRIEGMEEVERTILLDFLALACSELKFQMVFL